MVEIMDSTTTSKQLRLMVAAKIDGGEISYHIVEILPTNQDFLDENSTLGTELNELKFDQTLFNNAIGISS